MRGAKAQAGAVTHISFCELLRCAAVPQVGARSCMFDEDVESPAGTHVGSIVGTRRQWSLLMLRGSGIVVAHDEELPVAVLKGETEDKDEKGGIAVGERGSNIESQEARELPI